MRKLAGLLSISIACALAITAPAHAATNNGLEAPDTVQAGQLVPLSAKSGRSGGAWGFSSSARTWVKGTDVMNRSHVNRGPQAYVTRAQFVLALYKLERWRANEYGTPRKFTSVRRGALLSDVPRRSIHAKAVRFGWISAAGGRFRPGAPITANDAALGMAGVLGLRPDVGRMVGTLRNEVPGMPLGNVLYGSAHAMNRTLGLRYNHLQGYERYEVGPTERVRVGHVAYMMHRAAFADSWRIDSARQMSRLDLPALGRNQKRVLAQGIRLLGQPYVWGGETERYQPEGHGGFDCSGFTLRILNYSGVPATQRYSFGERTSMDMSRISSRKRLSRSQLRPGDAMFFGYRGTRSSPSENYHVGVYMGNGWFIHSSGGNAGPAIDQLNGYWADNYSWGRRVLRVYGG